jgi:hypothetical protein
MKRENVLKLVSSVLMLIMLASDAAAADIDGDGYELILVPLAMNGHVVSGAFGTQWTGMLGLYNPRPASVGVAGPRCFFPRCGIYEAGHIGVLDNGPTTDRPEVGLVLMVAANDAPSLTFSSRLWETTRRGQPRGIDLPIVREGEFFSGPVAFLSIPTDADVRVSLRLYNPWADVRSPVTGAERVMVEFLNPTGAVLTSTELALPIPGNPAERPDYPGFAAIHDLAAAFPVLTTVESVHVRVRPVREGAQYYAMVAVTDNETQTVAIVTAQ